MKNVGKIIICTIVVLTAIVIGYLVYNTQNNKPTNNGLNEVNNNQTNKENQAVENTTNNDKQQNNNYVGKEEHKEEPVEETKNEKEESEPSKENKPQELTGKDKAIDIVKKEYALEGQTVRYDHMEGENYIIKINDGTAVTWYLVDGKTWKAEEY